jgi:hypothetical protein
MMASVVPSLREWAIDDDAVRYEAFGPASIGSAENDGPMPLDAPIEVRFVCAGRTLDWTGEDTNLLDFAERHDVAVPSGCRSGSCGTCETSIESGAVRYAKPPTFDVAEGRCLLCVGMPTSALVLAA